MGNHFHILVKMIPEYKFTNQDTKKRYVDFYGDGRVFIDGLIPSLRTKLSSLSEFVREIKVGFARYYNKKHNRRGYFWGDRFKSVIVDKGETLVNCLAYTARAIFRIRASSAQRNLCPKITSDLNIYFIQSMKKIPGRSRAWMGCIR
jgi:hypothetical protein